MPIHLGLILLLLAAPARGSDDLRVATLLPSAEAAIALIPESATLVASVRRQIHTPLPSPLIDLGSPHSPNFEALAQADPQLVVGDESLHAPLKAQLAGLGAELFLLDTSSVESTLDSIARLGRRLQDGGQLEEAAQNTRAELVRTALSEPVEILILFGAPGSFFVVTDRAWIGDLATQLGFVNLAPDGQSERLPGFVPVNDEALAILRPEIVVLVAHGAPKAIEEALRERTRAGGAWAGLGQAPLGIHVLEPALFGANPGLDIASAGDVLVRLASPPSAAPSEPTVP